jgi:hypothetical protein
MTFNLKYILPNKFFEFIQARLAVAIGPSVEMKRLVKEWDCGIVAANFEAKSMAAEINRLTPGTDCVLQRPLLHRCSDPE